MKTFLLVLLAFAAGFFTHRQIGHGVPALLNRVMPNSQETLPDAPIKRHMRYVAQKTPTDTVKRLIELTSDENWTIQDVQRLCTTEKGAGIFVALSNLFHDTDSVSVFSQEGRIAILELRSHGIALQRIYVIQDETEGTWRFQGLFPAN